MAGRGTLAGQVVQITRRRQLRHLQVVLGGRAADHDGQVVGRAGRRAEATELLVEEPGQPRRIQQRLGLLVQERLVGAAAALGHEQELVVRSGAGGVVQLDLGRQVGTGVALLPEVQRCQLRVAQVELLVGVEDAGGDGGLVVAAGEHRLGALADHDRGPGVLAHRQHAACRDAGVAQQVGGHETVVRAGLRVVDDRPQLGQVRRAQQVLDVPDRLVGQEGQGGRFDREELAARDGFDADAVGGHQPVLGVVVTAQRQKFGVPEHRSNGHGGAAPSRVRGGEATRRWRASTVPRPGSGRRKAGAASDRPDLPGCAAISGIGPGKPAKPLGWLKIGVIEITSQLQQTGVLTRWATRFGNGDPGRESARPPCRAWRAERRCWLRFS